MAFDGAFMHCLLSEINEAKDCHVDKIYQPSRDELVLLLRKKGFVKRLTLTARQGCARMQFTENARENPERPPMFCMLARKYFSAARFICAVQNGLERVAELNFEAANEMADKVSLKIICEFIGSGSNVILLDSTGRIIDALRRSDIETSARIIAPGAVYKYPERPDKINPVSISSERAAETVVKSGEKTLCAALLCTLEGVSPLICHEIALRSYGEDISLTDISDTQPLIKNIELLQNSITSGGIPVMLCDGDGTPKEFSFMPILQYGDFYKEQTFESFSGLLEAFYGKREQTAIIHKAASDIIKLVSNLTARASRRMNTRLRELENCRDREKYRIYGELIKANIHLIKPGSTKVSVPNFYSEDLSEITIPLDPALSAAANAARCFKLYKKSYNAEQSLTSLIKEDELEIEYLSSVEESISRADKLSVISEIREELCTAGYIKGHSGGSRRKKAAPVFEEFVSPEGFRVLVGKNNMQNDYLTTTLAAKNDMWFHTKGVHGAHVIVMCHGQRLSDETVFLAARAAAKNSKAANSSNVAVDYTPVKYVKKPSGARPGMVIYTRNRTVYVTP